MEACKPRSAWRVGSEHEIIGVRAAGEDLGCAPAYDGPDGIGAVLEALSRNDWAPVREGGHIIALVKGDAQVTIEPGGQLELAARPVTSADEMKTDLYAHVRELAEPSKRFRLAWLGLGFRPFGTLDAVPWMPKERYAVMREYMPTRGSLAHEMMKRTATVQVNLDYSDPADAAEKMRATLSVTSILTALFASSPIVDNRVSGYQSYRARVWEDTSADRCGLLDFAFEDGDIFSAYIEWALDVPLFFVYRDGYRPVRDGTTFRGFMKNGFAGYRANIDDWALHLSTLFPEARMKRFIEVRGCDSGSMAMVLALAPLCRGFLYDETARRDAIALTASLTMTERRELARAVARQGLHAPVAATGRLVGDLARDLVAIATDGLRRQAIDEIPYLDPVREIAESGRTQADELIDIWQASDGDPASIIPKVSHCGLGADCIEPA